MRRTFTREQLFNLVWTQAVSKVALELGVSDVAVRKKCLRHSVPLPSNSYWGKVRSGKPVERPLLPEVADAPPIVFEGQTAWPENLDLMATVQQSHERAGDVVVPERLHAFAQKTVSLAKRSKQDDHGAVRVSGPDAFQVRAHPDTLDRIGRFLNALVHHAKARGYDFQSGQSGLAVRVLDELIPFKVNETVRRTHHVETEEERARVQRWDARHRGSWTDWDSRPRTPYWDFHATNNLALEIDGWLSGFRKRFADTRATKLETRIDGVLDGFHAWALGLKARREEDRLRAIAEEERRLLRVEQAKLAAVENSRREFVATLHDQLMELERAERVFVALEQRGLGGGGYGDWLKRYVAMLSARLEPLEVEAALTRVENEARTAAEQTARRARFY